MIESLLLAIELVGVVSFAVAGAIVAIDKETDLFGVVFLSLMTCFIAKAIVAVAPLNFA